MKVAAPKACIFLQKNVVHYSQAVSLGGRGTKNQEKGKTRSHHVIDNHFVFEVVSRLNVLRWKAVAICEKKNVDPKQKMGPLG